MNETDTHTFATSSSGWIKLGIAALGLVIGFSAGWGRSEMRTEMRLEYLERQCVLLASDRDQMLGLLYDVRERVIRIESQIDHNRR